MLATLAKGVLGRLLSYAALALGFWVLYQGISRPSLPLAILGGGIILGATYLMVAARRSNAGSPEGGPNGVEEDDPSDTIHGSGQGGKLPP
ncbi:MAG: hypothetical protein AAB528_05465 [Chloroflexota bacterium]